MSDQDVFNSEPKGAVPLADDVTTLLSSITNEEGKPKYDSVAKALEALRHSQEHIRKLEQDSRERAEELRRIREAETSRETVEELINKAIAAKSVETEIPSSVTPQSGPVDADAVSKLVRESLELERSREIGLRNIQEVQDALTKKFGDKAGEMVGAKATELGLTTEYLKNLAITSPKAALALFNVSQVHTSAPSTSSVNIPISFNNGATELARPTKSLLSGASTKDQVAYLQQVRAHVNAKLGVTD